MDSQQDPYCVDSWDDSQGTGRARSEIKKQMVSKLDKGKKYNSKVNYL